MLSELHLKFHSETGMSQVSQQLTDFSGDWVEAATEQYVEWLEELATKQIKREEPLHAEIKKLRKQLHEACDKLNQHGLL